MHPEYHKIIMESFPEYQFIESEFKGWMEESNIYFNRERFELVEFGQEDVGHSKVEPLRKLFWCTLKHIASDTKFKIFTVHISWQGSPEDKTTDVDMRKIIARKVVEILKTEPLDFFLCGDMNDQITVPKIFRSSKLISCFEELQIRGSSTHPSRTLHPGQDIYENETLDWIFRQGEKFRTVIANVMRYRFAGISDHYPVLAMYEIL
eukprot:TRINITY_DN611_c0_g1_i4.p1 TRINITY_DN611_c0_g1~~TRINITY_DN611_c0_g1_i4.p1  ORF type:complete len:207 (+),score=15.15 TRINITY_DN611_c0_g1_i4:160-780(+)